MHKIKKNKQRGFIINPFVFGSAGGGGAITYATWNPADKTLGMALSNGNHTVAYTADGYLDAANGYFTVRSTQAKNTGKCYFEIKIESTDIGSNRSAFSMGIWPITRSINTYIYNTIATYRIYAAVASSPGTLIGAVFGFIVNFIAGTMDVYRDNVLVDTKNFTVGTDLWAIILGDDNLGYTRAVLNAGDSAFAYPSRPSSAGALPGYYN